MREMDKNVQNTKDDNYTQMTQIKSLKKRENPVAAVLSCNRKMAYKREGTDFHSHLRSANRNGEMGREAQCVDTIDLFLIQP